MKIKVFGNNFSVSDAQTCWKISRTVGGLTISLNISKDLCATMDDLQAYIHEHPKLLGGDRKDG